MVSAGRPGEPVPVSAIVDHAPNAPSAPVIIRRASESSPALDPPVATNAWVTEPDRPSPAFLAELLLTFGVIVAATNTQWVRRALWRDPVLACLVGFMLWGLFRTV